MNKDDKDFIVQALNAYWNDAHNNLQSKSLGDIERKNYQYQLQNSKRLINDLENPNKWDNIAKEALDATNESLKKE